MDQAPKRKHRANGKPVGGKRPGAGRPRGSENTLELGEVKAIKAANLRLPKDAPEPIKLLANRALERIVEVLEQQVHYTDAGNVLKAATRLREEACGPLMQKLALTDPTGDGPLQVIVQKYGDEEEDADPDFDKGGG